MGSVILLNHQHSNHQFVPRVLHVLPKRPMISQVHGEMVEPLLAIIHGTRTIHNPKITQMESHGSK